MSTVMHEWPRRHRISVEHYYRMAEAGLFAPDERVELIDGELVDMPPMGSKHAAKLLRLGDILAAAVGDRGMVRMQVPLRLGDHSEPQPDIVVVMPRADYYENQHPIAADTLLAIELSDSTLRFDHEVKAPLYARQGVPETWIVNVRANRLIRFQRPAAGGEPVVAETDLGVVSLYALPGISVDLAPLVTHTPEG